MLIVLREAVGKVKILIGQSYGGLKDHSRDLFSRESSVTWLDKSRREKTINKLSVNSI